MRKPPDPRELAEAILHRSPCAVKVGAVLADSAGIFAWGWNHPGSGFGLHAEAHCISRANRSRLAKATLYVAAMRARNRKAVPSRPCSDCQNLVCRVSKVVWRDSDKEWRVL